MKISEMLYLLMSIIFFEIKEGHDTVCRSIVGR